MWHTEQTLVLSTAHVPIETARWLDRAQDDPSFPTPIIPRENVGWLIWVPTDNFDTEDEVYGTDLAGIFSAARSQNCEWVMLDKDAQSHPSLPTYDW